jgi:TP901 family phage tail tape measure protein
MNNFAVTSAGLGEAMTRSASALDIAGNSIQQTAGMITGIVEVTQDPEKAGSSLRTLSLRLRGMKGKLEELGEEVDDNVENISKMQGQILNMTGGKVNIFDGAGEFKSTYEIMKGIAEVWDDLNSIDQANLLETIAGGFCQNIQKCIYRIHLIALNSLEPYTTIIGKLDYDGLKT